MFSPNSTGIFSEAKSASFIGTERLVKDFNLNSAKLLLQNLIRNRRTMSYFFLAVLLFLAFLITRKVTKFHINPVF